MEQYHDDPETIRRWLGSLVGRTVTGIRLEQYVYHGTVDEQTGRLELSLDGSSRLLFGTGLLGQQLRLEEGPWADQLAGLSAADRQAYVDQYGTWTIVRVDDRPPFSALLGKTVDRVWTTEWPDGSVIGAIVAAGGVVCRVEVAADELHVDIGGEEVIAPRFRWPPDIPVSIRPLAPG